MVELRDSVDEYDSEVEIVDASKKKRRRRGKKKQSRQSNRRSARSTANMLKKRLSSVGKDLEPLGRSSDCQEVKDVVGSCQLHYVFEGEWSCGEGEHGVCSAPGKRNGDCAHLSA